MLIVDAVADIEINQHVRIPESELILTYVRSPGPGGQNVNKVATKAVLAFDLAGSPSLTEFQKERIRSKLANRISREGLLRLQCGRHRSQEGNRREVIGRFKDSLAAALRREKPRKPTRPTRGSVEKRLTEKSRRSQVKRDRRSGRSED